MGRFEKIKARFQNSNYRTDENVELADGSHADLVASRAYFSWKGLVIQSLHVVIKTIDHPTTADVKSLFELGFKIGKKRNRVPLFRGLQFGYMILPAIIARSVAPEIRELVSQQPPKHFALMEFPVICIDEESEETICFEGTPLWGALYFSDARRVVTDFLKV